MELSRSTQIYAVKTILITLFPDDRYEKNREERKPREAKTIDFVLALCFLSHKTHRNVQVRVNIYK